MKIVGIICEYNPFHMGHLRQFRMIKEKVGEDVAIVCLMSGNYVQRGEPAMWDKFTRAQAAVECGADVVLELPITGVLQSAEGFARCGVDILSRFGADILCFGAECGSAEQMMSLAVRMRTPAFQQALRQQLAQGLSYAAARQKALNDQDMLTKPNNILALEYCKAILDLQSRMEPMAVQRNGDYHAQIAKTDEPSATAIRRLVPSGNWQEYIPAAHVFCNKPWYALEFGERAVLARLRSMTEGEWQQVAHGSEGLWSKAMKASRKEANLWSVMEATKSKRYPMTRIQRLFLCAYLGITAGDLSKPYPYVRILSAGEKGLGLLRMAKKAECLHLINPGQIPQQDAFFELETRAADLYTLFAAPGFETVCRTEQTARIALKK